MSMFGVRQNNINILKEAKATQPRSRSVIWYHLNFPTAVPALSLSFSVFTLQSGAIKFSNTEEGVPTDSYSRKTQHPPHSPWSRVLPSAKRTTALGTGTIANRLGTGLPLHHSFSRV